MQKPERAVRVGGTWIALASLLMIVVFATHGPIAHDLNEQMTKISGAGLRWSLVHWTAAAALSLYAVGALILMTSQSELTEGFWTLTGWAVICVGCLWTVTTAVAETTVVTEAARAGNEQTFFAWWAFAEGKATGFAFVALAIAAIAAHEARRAAGATPAWAARVGMVGESAPSPAGLSGCGSGSPSATSSGSCPPW